MTLKMNFTSNFTPVIKKQTTINKKKIFLKSFFIFILFLKSHGNIKNVSLFIKPKQYRSFVMLRAPYRYKLARLQLTLNRFNIFVFLKIETESVNTFKNITFNKKNHVKLGESFETIFMHQKKFTFLFNIVDEKNFLIKNFIVKFAKPFFL